MEEGMAGKTEKAIATDEFGRMMFCLAMGHHSELNCW